MLLAGGDMKATLFLTASCSLIALGLFSAKNGYAQWTDNDPSNTGKCESAGVNDAGTSIMDCEVSDVATPYVTLAGQDLQLGVLAGKACYDQEINNAASGKETVIGKCLDTNDVWQAVEWSTASPSIANELLPANVLLGILVNGQSSQSTAVDLYGDVIGVSFDNQGVQWPAVWQHGSLEPTLLAAPLLYVESNCLPISINDATSPSVIGNCPSGSSGHGKTDPVLWQTLTSSYTVLPFASGATDCYAKQINLAGEIIGDCYYSADVTRAVEWGAGGTGPTVLMTVNGTAVQSSFTARENDSGVVAIEYKGSGSTASKIEPAIWNPSGGNSNAGAVQLPAQALNGIVGEIGNNGKSIGYYETGQGTRHPFHVEANSLVAVDDGSPEGGYNAWAEELSPSGTFEAGKAENSSGNLQAITESVP
jgi:hypothetical protein